MEKTRCQVKPDIESISMQLVIRNIRFLTFWTFQLWIYLSSPTWRFLNSVDLDLLNLSDPDSSEFLSLVVFRILRSCVFRNVSDLSFLICLGFEVFWILRLNFSELFRLGVLWILRILKDPELFRWDGLDLSFSDLKSSEFLRFRFSRFSGWLFLESSGLSDSDVLNWESLWVFQVWIFLSWPDLSLFLNHFDLEFVWIFQFEFLQIHHMCVSLSRSLVNFSGFTGSTFFWILQI